MTVSKKKKQLSDVTEIIQFEQWIRFYYINEKDDSALSIDIPEEVMSSIEKDLPQLAKLAGLMDKEDIDYKKSCETVCAFIGSRIDVDPDKPNIVPRLLDSKEFKIEMYLFNLWIKSHEDLLDSEPKTFPQWQEMYTEWLNTEQVVEYRNQLVNSDPSATENGNNSVH